MSTTLSAKYVKARKPYYCDACGALAIRPGDEYFRKAVAESGTVYVWLTCSPCREIARAVFDWVADPDAGVGIEEYREWATEAVKDGGPLAANARAYLDRTHRGAARSVAP